MEGYSLYGRTFEDEGFDIKFDRKGILGMWNEGRPHSNASQFFITFDAVCLGRYNGGLMIIFL